MPESNVWKRGVVIAIGAVLLLIALFAIWPRPDTSLPGVTYEARYVDAGPMLHLADVLSSDALEGRASGTPGNDAARGFIRKRFEDIGLKPYLASGWEHPVTILPRPGLDEPGPGANLIGFGADAVVQPGEKP